MLKQLRRRVILLTMAAVVLVFAAVLGTVNIVSHISNEQEADALLTTLSENGGTFPQEVVGQQETVTTVDADSSEETSAADASADADTADTVQDSAAAEDTAADAADGPAAAAADDTTADAETDAAEDDTAAAKDEKPDRGDLPDSTQEWAESEGRQPKHYWYPDPDDDDDDRGREEEEEPSESPTPTPMPSPQKEIHYIFQQVETAETRYETRYFSVLFSESGNLASVDTSEIAAVTTEQAAAMAEKLLAAGKTEGYERDYKYLAVDEDGQTLYVFLDCTRSRHSERQLLLISLLVSGAGILLIFLLLIPLSRRLIRPVAESYEKQKQFITNAGHEIKTPLAVIDSCTEVLELESGDSENRWIQGIRSETARLAELTRRMTALAKMDEGSRRPEMAELGISELAGDLARDYALLAEQKGLTLQTEIETGVRCNGNAPMLEELCVILLDNAVKYCAPEGTIRFSVQAKGRHVVISGENPAENLTQGRQTRAFDRFYRGDISHSSTVSGYGIGLSMAQSIVTAHRGKIAADSPDGQKFVITAIIAR